MPSRKRLLAIVAAAAGAATAALVAWRLLPQRSTVLRYQTMAGPAHIYTIEHDDGPPTRVMEVGGAQQSATYIDDDLCYDLVFGYHRAYNALFDAGISIDRLLVLGGGGFSYPEHVVSTHPKTCVDVVEIDPMVTALARRWFFLDRLEAEFAIQQTGRLRIHECDGRSFVESCTGRYEAVVNDCFSGRAPVVELATIEAARQIKRCLTPGGMYLSNVIGSLQGEHAAFVEAVCSTLAEVFENVWILPGQPDDASKPDNNVVIASDASYRFKGAIDAGSLRQVPALRDESAHERDWTVPFA